MTNNKDWSYSEDPNASDLDRVRFEIGDTNENDPLLMDTEIDFAIKEESNLYLAAARCCEAIVAKLATDTNYRLGPKSVDAAERSKAYRQLALEFRRKGAIGFFVGGVSKSDERKVEANPDLKKPTFKRGMMSNRREC